MDRLVRKALGSAAVGLCLMIGTSSTFAQTCDPKDPKCNPPPPPRTTADCSPGFYKSHPETWCDTICPTTGLLPTLYAPLSTAPRKNRRELASHDGCFVPSQRVAYTALISP
jgi:hypothetical protein